MSIRLKSRNQSCPGGFQFIQRETGWGKENAGKPKAWWDFRLLCTELQKHRLANPKFKLNTNLGAIMDEVDEANARRMLSIRGADIYVTSTDGSSPKLPAPRPPVVGGGANPVSGITLLKDLLEGDPVHSEVSNRRAFTCTNCPQNGKGDWKRYFTIPVANAIKLAVEARTGMKLSTFHDESLGICEACTCPLKIKVHTRLDTVLKHTTEEVMEKLPEFCWIKSENSAHAFPDQ